MRFLVVSGRSGSGKTTALHLLEDEGFTCIDNIPVTLLPALIEYISTQSNEKFAVGIDARNTDSNLGLVGSILENSAIAKDDYRIIFLDTQTDVLFKRFSETRRRHPLSDEHTDLSEALEKERSILAPIVNLSDITIDTSGLNLHELRSTIRRMVLGDETKGIAIMFTSFGFKHGSPTDADFIFDVRSLPNPYWEPKLRLKTGLEKEVQDYLAEQKEVKEMIEDVSNFVKKWVPSFQANNRSYLTIAIGCTGGMHRSVYISERLSEALKVQYKNVLVRHRHIDNKKTH